MRLLLLGGSGRRGSCRSWRLRRWRSCARRTGRRRWRRHARRLWRFGLLAARTPQYRRPLIIVHASGYGRHRLLNRPCLKGACRLPAAFGHPFGCAAFIFSLERARHGEQTLGNPGEHAFVNRLAPQRHRHGSGLVCAGIVVFSIDLDRDWNQMGLAIGGQFDQTQGSRSLVLFRSMSDLGGDSERKNSQNQNCGDDAPPHSAV